MDGYDGGVLPLNRYVPLQRLLLPPELMMPDGRLPRQLRGVPDDRLLDLTGVRFVITDKQNDLWVDDVYYDLELGAHVEPGQELALDLAVYRPFPATVLSVVAEVANDVPAGNDLARADRRRRGWTRGSPRLACGPATWATPAPTRMRRPTRDADLAHRARAGGRADDLPARHQPDR